MSTAALLSVEEYLHRSEKPNCEYLDGVLRPKAMPTKSHSLLQYLLVGLLRQSGLEALHEVLVRLSPARFLVPDVIAAPHIQDPYPTEPVLLCVEILSPEGRLGATLAKCEEYHAWGVPFCWVIDPAKRTAWEYHNGGEPVRVDVEGVVRAGDVVVRLHDLFSELSR